MTYFEDYPTYREIRYIRVPVKLCFNVDSVTFIFNFIAYAHEYV